MSDAHPEQAYLDLLRELLDHGTYKNDRTGTGTYSKFGHQMRYDLSKGFPLFTTKRLHLRSIIHELLWFLAGDTNVGYLNRNGVTIWDEWARGDGDLGPVYGKQWRSWEKPDGGTIDQMSWLVDEIKRNPDSRRLIVSAWNPADLDKMALAPCHCLFQYYVVDSKLSCQLFQRSCDSLLGLPFNVSSYVLLQYMIAQQCNLGLGEFIHTFGDVHLYANHVEQARTQIAREPRPFPQMLIKRKPASLFDYAFEDFEIVGYEPHAAIKAPIAV